MNETAKQLSAEELEGRIAVLRRFRTLLEQQREKFQEYLRVLELQEGKIKDEDAEAIIAHSNLEEQIVRNIGSLQKVIVPMQRLYTRVSTYNPADSEPVTKLQSDLTKLRSQVLAQNLRNRQLLKSRMAGLQDEMTQIQIKNPYRSHQSVYAEQDGTGNLVHVEV